MSCHVKHVAQADCRRGVHRSTYTFLVTFKAGGLRLQARVQVDVDHHKEDDGEWLDTVGTPKLLGIVRRSFLCELHHEDQLELLLQVHHRLIDRFERPARRSEVCHAP